MGWGWGSAALQVIVQKLHPFSCNTSSILTFQQRFCYYHTFSMEGEIAGLAEISSCYVICDTCPTSSDLGQMGFGPALHPVL